MRFGGFWRDWFGFIVSTRDYVLHSSHTPSGVWVIALRLMQRKRSLDFAHHFRPTYA
jgi:hypothetical protein